MATRNPLVMIDGAVHELPAGDVVAGVGTFPFYLASGTRDDIALIAGSALPFFLASGVQDNINLVA